MSILVRKCVPAKTFESWIMRMEVLGLLTVLILAHLVQFSHLMPPMSINSRRPLAQLSPVRVLLSS